MASSSCISDANIATEQFIEEATSALELPEKCKLEDVCNVVADEKSEPPLVPSAPSAISCCNLDTHIATEEFFQEATLALEVPENSKLEAGTHVVADENSVVPFVPSAPLASSYRISYGHIATEEFIKEITLALEVSENSKLEDGTNVIADEKSAVPFVPSAPLASSTCISDAHIAIGEFIKEVTLALEVPGNSKLEDGTNFVADEISVVPFVPSAPLASSTCISDAHIATEQFIKEVALALEVPENSKLEDGSNVVADENSAVVPFVPSAPLASSNCISDAHIATDKFIKGVKLALEVQENSKLEDGTNVVADENSVVPFVPSAPLASSTCISDAHNATEQFIKEVALALEVPENSKLEDGSNVVADENNEPPLVPSTPLARSSCNLDTHIATEEFIQKATLAREILEKCKLEENKNVAADEKSESPRVPSALFDSSTVASTAYTPSTLKRGAFEADECIVHDEKTEASCRSAVRTNN